MAISGVKPSTGTDHGPTYLRIRPIGVSQILTKQKSKDLSISS